MRKFYTVTMIEAARTRTVERVLRIEARSQTDATTRAARLYRDANIERVEGPHD